MLWRIQSAAVLVLDSVDWQCAIRAEARRHLAIHCDPALPADLDALARGLGVRICRWLFADDPEFTGTLTYTDSGYAVIVANLALPSARYRFTVAHELGHYALRTSLEEAANAYASEVLVPTDRLLAQVRAHGQNPNTLAHLNEVSPAMMRIRLGELPTASARWIGSDGWHSLHRTVRGGGNPGSTDS
jgi:Zn-dependent peptidase ImmA (M78 family)